MFAAHSGLQQALPASELPLPDLPHVLQAAVLPGPHLQELLPSTHLHSRQIHSLLLGHPAGMTGNVLGRGQGGDPASGVSQSRSSASWE